MAKMLGRYLLFSLTVLLSVLPATVSIAQEENKLEVLTGQLRQLLGTVGHPAVLNIGGYGLFLTDDTLRFYRQRRFTAAWLTPQELSEQGRRLLAVLRSAAEEGLRPEEYHVDSLEVFVEQLAIFKARDQLADPLLLSRLDILLSDAFLRYAADLNGGRVEAAEVYPQGWRTAPRRADLVQTLQLSLEYGRVVKVLRDMVPVDPGYRRLRDYLAYYRQLAAAGGWPQLPEGPSLDIGQSDWRVPWLQDYLIKSGDLAAEDRSADRVFDEATAAALKRFQQRHGLQTDGVLGPKTLAALNLSVEERIRQIEINLERWRWLPRDLGRRHLVVNIPGFQLEVVEEGQPVLAMPVIVGTDRRRTPVFSARMRYLDFAPYWNVPPTILREDKLPLIKADLNYLAAHHYEIIGRQGNPVQLIGPETIDWEVVKAENFPGMLRQKPGPWNPLGRVKFMFPNRFHVYMHDTPEKYLFEHKRRSFSSGCIRVKQPFELALYLLQEQDGWDDERIEEAMAGKEPLRVPLDESLPVHILYRTAWVDADGRLQFRNDIYQRDAVLYTALRRHNRKTATLVACNPVVLR